MSSLPTFVCLSQPKTEDISGTIVLDESEQALLHPKEIIKSNLEVVER